ncbi:MAG: hypothetical protein LBR62_02570, partial [Puniceicoccales bacterium]|nr:hypothetical protein [Puniceicoccales bacterium]
MKLEKLPGKAIFRPPFDGVDRVSITWMCNSIWGLGIPSVEEFKVRQASTGCVRLTHGEFGYKWPP